MLKFVGVFVKVSVVVVTVDDELAILNLNSFSKKYFINVELFKSIILLQK